MKQQQDRARETFKHRHIYNSKKFLNARAEELRSYEMVRDDTGTEAQAQAQQTDAGSREMKPRGYAQDTAHTQAHTHEQAQQTDAGNKNRHSFYSHNKGEQLRIGEIIFTSTTQHRHSTGNYTNQYKRINLHNTAKQRRIGEIITDFTGTSTTHTAQRVYILSKT